MATPVGRFDLSTINGLIRRALSSVGGDDGYDDDDVERRLAGHVAIESERRGSLWWPLSTNLSHVDNEVEEPPETKFQSRSSSSLDSLNGTAECGYIGGGTEYRERANEAIQHYQTVIRDLRFPRTAIVVLSSSRPIW